MGKQSLISDVKIIQLYYLYNRDDFLFIFFLHARVDITRGAECVQFRREDITHKQCNVHVDTDSTTDKRKRFRQQQGSMHNYSQSLFLIHSRMLHSPGKQNKRDMSFNIDFRGEMA